MIESLTDTFDDNIINKIVSCSVHPTALIIKQYWKDKIERQNKFNEINEMLINMEWRNHYYRY